MGSMQARAAPASARPKRTPKLAPVVPLAGAMSTTNALSGVPRLAATVVLLRPAGATFECYMLRRSSGSPFMPDTLVFPGGRLDAEDGDADDDATWTRAAARECCEEAAVELDAATLEWFDTWCTPSGEPRRFLARFFLAMIGEGDGEGACADGTETIEGRWWTAAAAIAAWRSGAADLPPPTLCTLLRLEAVGCAGLREDAAAAHAAAELAVPILPKAILAGGEIHVVMPHDPDYEAAAGDAIPPPARVHLHPRRFTRREGRWTPG